MKSNIACESASTGHSDSGSYIATHLVALDIASGSGSGVEGLSYPDSPIHQYEAEQFLPTNSEFCAAATAIAPPAGASRYVQSSDQSPMIAARSACELVAESGGRMSVSSFHVTDGEPLGLEANYFAALHHVVLFGLTHQEANKLNDALPATWMLLGEDRRIEVGYTLGERIFEHSDAKRVLNWARERWPDHVISWDGWFRLPDASSKLLLWAPDTRHSAGSIEAFFKKPVEPDATPSVWAEDALVSISPSPRRPPSAFAQFSLQGHLEEVEKLAVDQRPVLGRLAMEGQATCIYAAPSTGKTLTALHLLGESITSGGLDPARIHYINMDDNPEGLVEKGRLAEELGFHMLADGFRGFSIKQFHATFADMVRTKTVNGAILILDTLKKFVDTMSKSEARNFTTRVRQFVTLGGTVIALAHTNKNPGADGKPIYAGTTDILDDFDCVHIVSRVDQKVDAASTVVVFENKKSRGRVALTAAYQYASGADLSYAQRLASVQEVDPEQWKAFVPTEEERTDSEVIKAVETSIVAGTTMKMALANDVSKRIGCSRQRAVSVIEKYASPACPTPRWQYTRRERGAHHYVLVDRPGQT